MSISLMVFQGRAGDHNDLAIPGAKAISGLLSSRLGLAPTIVGTPERALSTDWRRELEVALPSLRVMQAEFERIFSEGHKPVAATSRCTVSIATLPVVAKYRKDACVVWFDAHADLNTPESTTTGYLGGLALSGPAGMWDSGLGDGLALENIVLVGQRDLDPFEIELIESGKVKHIKPGPNVAAELSVAIVGRPVYMHLDCDVLDPGIVPTDYVHEGGLTLDDLRAACQAIAQGEVIGIEVAEFQNSWTVDGDPVSPGPLLEALEPIFDRLRA
ncbi:arginase [Burkholderia sp. SRS-46]|nr:arginase [Burkholderia sp. SRS-46]